MSILNGLLRPLFDGLLLPFRALPWWVGLGVVSLVVGVGILLIFKVTSNQEKLALVKRQIHAGLFEIRLFNDDLRAILRAQFDILRHNLNYLRLSFVPLVWILPPLVLVMGQLQFHYGYKGLEPGEPVLLELRLGDAYDATARPTVEVQVPEGLRLDSPPVWIPSEREMAWRLVAERPGDYELGFTVNGESASKRVVSSDRIVRRAPVRPRAGFSRELLYTAEPPLPGDGAIEAIEVAYPPAMLDAEWGWMVPFFALSTVFAFALRGRFGVTL